MAEILCSALPLSSIFTDHIVSVVRKEFADDEPYKFNLNSSLSYTYKNGTNQLEKITAKTELGENSASVDYGKISVGNMPDAVYYGYHNGVWSHSYHYDELGRISAVSVMTNPGFIRYTYNYKTISGNRTSTQVSSFSSNYKEYSYNYDNRGNILSVSDGTNTTTYTYDNLNQLTRENNQKLGKTYVYTYSNGNITSRKEYAYTTGTLGTASKTDTFTYSAYAWGDLLVAINGEFLGYTHGETTRMNGKELEWGYLGNLTKIGDTTYSYDTSGRRLSKTTNGVTTNYYYAGDLLVGEKTGNNKIEYLFDINGDYYGFEYNDKPYYYFKNLQGDVVAVGEDYNTVVATYEYDAWGRLISSTDTSGVNIGAINPIRYRGYYYDTETGFYFLQTRYYVPEICRFLSADSILDDSGVNNHNLFAYCANNPVTREDEGGQLWDTVFDAVSLVFSVVDVVRNPKSVWSWVGLAADVASLVIPFATGGGLAVKAISKIDDVADVARGVNRVDNAVDTAAAINKVSNGYSATRAVDYSGTSFDLSGGACFIEGTPILTENGKKSIEEINVGDYVYARDPKTGTTGLQQVLQTFINETDELIYLSIHGEEIITTPEHPFFVSTKGWITAINLRAGDILVTVNGEYVVLEKIQHEILETPITVYNFEVKDFHTYYVGSNCIFVHNMCGVKNTLEQTAVIQLAKEFKSTGLSRIDANILWDWTEETGLSNLNNYHAPKFDSYLGGTQYHMKINGKHINIFD